MRLPQSLVQSLFHRAVHFQIIGVSILLLGMAPVNAGGSTTPQLTCTPARLRFGGVIVGQTETLLATVTNSGQQSLTVSSITLGNSEFALSGVSLPLVLAAGQSVEVSVSFTPTATGWTGGNVRFFIGSNSALGLEVEGSGVSSEALTASPSTVSFGQVSIGSSSTLPVVLTNVRPWSVTLKSLQTTVNGFSVSGPLLPYSLRPGQSVTLHVTFTPQWTGTAGGALFVTNGALAIPLSGIGSSGAAGQLSIAPAPLNFGNVTVGNTATQAITVSATGANVTISSAASNNSQFVLEGASFPLTIAAGTNVSFNVAFTPKSGGAASGSLSFVNSGTNSPAPESLAGTGTLAQYSVNLSWNAGNSDVVGYNVYRSLAPNGTYSKINSSMDPNTSFTDSTVVSGQTYYYAATSVTSAGQESARSSSVQAVIP